MYRNMELQLDTIKLPAWNPELAGEWDEAFEKVENYLRACRVASRLHRARLVALILERAFNRRAADPAVAAQPLATVAIDEAHHVIEDWVLHHLPPQDGGRPHTLPEGFLALYLCDAPMRWPNAFLNPQLDPPGFAETLRARMVQTGPELEISSMVPRQMDRGFIPELAEALESLERMPVIKTLLAWLLFAIGLLLLFWYTRG